MASPTVVVGLGAAGCRMVSKIRETANEQGVDQSYEYIAIDTDSETIDEELPSLSNTILLEKPEEEWPRAVERFPYLTEHHDESGLEGTVRQRAVARYHLDETTNLDLVYKQLDNIVSDFVGQPHINGDVRVWVVNSLGGGTGSGAFPLVTGILQSILDNQTDTSFAIMGIGSLPRLDNLDAGLTGIEGGAANYSMNAYAALRELRVLLGEESPDEPSRSIERRNGDAEIPLISDTNVIDVDAVPIRIPLFERYFLLGFREPEDGPHYRENMNKIVANLILYMSVMSETQLENFPDIGAGLENERIFSINGAELRVPVEEISELINLEADIVDVSDNIDSLEDEISDYEDAVDYLDEVIKGREPPEDSELVNNCEEIVNNYSLENFYGEDYEQYYSETVVPNVEALLQSYHRDIDLVDEQDILELVYFRKLEEKLREDINDHSFVAEVEREWSNLRSKATMDTIESEFPAIRPIDNPTAEDKWNYVLEEYLLTQKERHQPEDSGGIGGAIPDIDVSLPFGSSSDKEDYSDKSDEYDAKIKSIQDSYEDYEKRREVHQKIKENRDDIQKEFREKRSELQTTLQDDLNDRLESLENRLERYQNRRNGLITNLVESADDSKFTNVLLDTDYLNTLDADTFDIEGETMLSLVNEGVIDEGEMNKELIRLADNIRAEPIEDLDGRYVETDSTTVNWPIVLLSEDNNEILHRAPEGSSSFLDSDAIQRYTVAPVIEHGSADQFSIRLLGMHSRFELVNTSELGSIHHSYISESDSLRDLLGTSNIDPDAVQSRFAYPELVPEDDSLDELVLDS